MKSSKPEPGDEAIEDITEALKIAAKSARDLAQKTNTPLVVMRDGKLVTEYPGQNEKENSEKSA